MLKCESIEFTKENQAKNRIFICGWPWCVGLHYRHKIDVNTKYDQNHRMILSIMSQRFEAKCTANLFQSQDCLSFSISNLRMLSQNIHNRDMFLSSAFIVLHYFTRFTWRLMVENHQIISFLKIMSSCTLFKVYRCQKCAKLHFEYICLWTVGTLRKSGETRTARNRGEKRPRISKKRHSVAQLSRGQWSISWRWKVYYY